jgi:hemolysin-activating ACP:hemolysin acyltransferase
MTMAFWSRPEGTNAPTGSDVSATVGNGARGVSAGGPSKSPEAPKPVPSGDQLRKMAAAYKALASTFGEIVTLLMRSPQYKNLSIADMEWLVLPALRTGQFSLANVQSQTNGSTTPVALVLWASVSDEVDKRLSAALNPILPLEPQEWKSGGIIWVIAAIGDRRILRDMLQRLQEKDWARKPAKVIAVAKDGKPTVATLADEAA